MKLLVRAVAIAAVLFAVPGMAQSTATSVQAPAGYAPMQAPCVKQVDSTCVPISVSNPLPTSAAALPTASSTPCDAAITSTAVTPTGCSASITSGTATVGGFAPQLGRNLRVLITGTWTGTVAVGTSGNASCTTFNPLTIAGTTWGSFTGNANEDVDTPHVGTAYYCLQATVTSGTANVSLRQ